ncbi:MAG: hypothetical protein K2N94_01075 [Lachnospiraceae bacterium]|nr:hypothetical protein [Lachnospiraceae bacterium]
MGNAAEEEQDDKSVSSTKGQSGALRNPGGSSNDDSKGDSDNKGGSNKGDSDNDSKGGEAGDDSGSSSGTGAYWDPQGSVKLGRYLDIAVEKVKYEVTDEQVQEEIDYFLWSNSELVEIEGRNTVEAGDIVNVDFTLYIKGEEIDSETGSNVEIGSYSYDFEDGLIGVLRGECKTVETEIVDMYYSDYVGQTGTYVVTVNMIQKREIPELTDELVAGNTGYSTVEEYRQGVYDGLLESAEQTAWSEQIRTLFEKIFENSEFTGLSDADKQSYVEGMISYYTAYANYFGTDLEGFAYANGYTYDEFIDMLEEDAEFVVRRYLLLDAVAEAENLQVSDQEYADGLEDYASDNGYNSPEEAEDELGKEEILRDMRRDKAYELIVDAMILK